MYYIKYFITIYPHIDYLLIDEFIIIFLENHHNVIIHSSSCDFQSSVKQWTYAQAWMRFQNIIVHIIIDDYIMKFRNVVYKLSSGGARQILRLTSTGGTQSR